MREMKDSGIPWIGEIPKDWSVVPHKRVMYKVKEIQEHYNGENILSLTMRGVIVRDLEAGGKMPTSFDGYQKVYPNNLLQCLFDIDVTPRCVGLIRNEGLTSPAYSQFAMYPNGYAPYYDYLLRYMDDRKTLLHLSKNLRSSLTETDFGAIYTCVPSSIEEQQRIAEFLDRKCAEVDEMIALQEQIIEELKAYKQSVITEAVTKGLNPAAPMRDSGIEWIGSIPEHWEVKPLKWDFDIIAGATPKTDNANFWDGNIPWITPADYKTEDRYISQGRRNLSEEGMASCATTLLPKGSIIFSKRAPIGLVVINSQPLCTNQGCIGCVPKKDDARYYYYTMSIFTEQYELFGSGTTFKEISASNFADFRLPHPSLTEQQAIADYLDEKCADIDSLIQTKQSKIDSLKEYKKSIIYEYVTGKREVE